ncbi:PfkB family carbohydrate kinase, partial [Eubacterium aggregans]|uniref:PfkB family carbohydrate kinase n=1 Tax=Eubacterium aggregans TaxID=81409 RepID=UPI003F383505
VTFINQFFKYKTGMATVLLTEGAHNRIVIFPGANSKTGPQYLESAFEMEPDALMMQLEISMETNQKALDLAQKKGIITCLDAGPAQKLPLEALRGLTILSPNETETKAITGIFPDTKENCRAAAQMMKEKAKCQYVVIKRGEHGAYVFGDKIDAHISDYTTNCVDPTAAGDAFAGAMVKHYVEHRDILKAVRLANAVGGLACTKLGAQPSLPNAVEVATFLKTVSEQ